MRGRRQVALQTKAKNIARKPRRASLHGNQGRLRTPLPRSHTAKIRCGHFALPIEGLLINRTQAWKAQ